MMLTRFRLLAKRQQIFKATMILEKQPNTKKLAYQDFLKIYRWQNYRNTKNTK